MHTLASALNADSVNMLHTDRLLLPNDVLYNIAYLSLPVINDYIIIARMSASSLFLRYAPATVD